VKRRLFLAGGALAAVGCRGGGQKTVAVIPKGTSHIFWLTVQAGAVAAGKQFHLNIEWNGPAQETEYARQIQIVDSMIARRVDGIVLAAADRKSLVQPVDRAMAAGIPVTIFDSGLDSTNYMSFVATDNVEAGRLAARTLAKAIGGKGEVGVVMHVPGSVSTMDREAGFDETIAKEFPGIQIVQKLYGMSDRGKSMAAAENILTVHPGLAGIFCSTEPSATGTALALKSRGLGGKVKMVGFDWNDAMVADIKAGVIYATIIQDPFRMGFEAVQTLSQKLSGGNPPKRIDLPATAITVENLDKIPK
jgi:ribose transport system substrate-binding protein